jgi:hypothetical protein
LLLTGSMLSSIELLLKSRFVGTPAERFGKRLRWLLGAGHRLRYPELWELYLEELRLPLILRKLLTDSSCGVDVGSHLGSFLSLLTTIAPNGRHIAFEPITSISSRNDSHRPKCFPLLWAAKLAQLRSRRILRNPAIAACSKAPAHQLIF